MWTSAFFCLALATVVMGEQFILPLEKKPLRLKSQDGCYLTELDRILRVGASWASPKECVLYTCEEDAITIATCPSVQQTSECHVESKKRSKNVPYPYCCPRCKEMPDLYRSLPLDSVIESYKVNKTF